ncbi:hypothetical protein AGMMS49965_21650 [Bacteroidia bacterium]|nr:hypothetical protein AGMMS49965_21650 [Bacteroidia bacterium]
MRILSLITVFSLIVHLCTAQVPTRLTTDLLEHTDRVFLDGYPASVALEELGNTIERYQVAEIRSAQPSFGWVVNSTQPNTLQTAYRILVASSRELLSNDQADKWDSGKTNSDNSVAVFYGGEPLQPTTIYYWKVKTWDNHGTESEFSQVKSFITAQKTDGATASYPLQITDELPVAIKRLGENHSFIDFGKASFGRLKLTLTAHQETDTVIVRLGEAAKDGQVDREPNHSIRFSEYKLPLMSGTHTYLLKIHSRGRQMPDYIGEVMPFRYCELENYPAPIHAKQIVRQTVHYPFDETASAFHSSDSILNQVWAFCKYSVKATSFLGVFVDGDRERVSYEGDMLIGQLTRYAVDRQYEFSRRSYENLVYSPTWPTEWNIHDVTLAWHDYLYTGNPASLQKQYDELKKKSLIGLTEKNGLISTRTGKQTPELLASLHFAAGNQMRDIVDFPPLSSYYHTPCVSIADKSFSFPAAKFKTGDAPDWKTSDFNDTDWVEIKTTKCWEPQGYDKYDGYASYRMHLVIPAEMQGKLTAKDSILIDLGQIDDADETYFNGILIGKTGRFPTDEDGFLGCYDVPRKYRLAANHPAIRWGKDNVLTIRVYDDAKGGGIEGLSNDGKGETDDFVFTDYNIVVNAFHYQALRLLSEMAAALGKPQEQAQFTKDAERVKDRINRLLFDSKTGLYRDGIGTNHHSLHANMYPLAFGIVPKKNKQKVLDFIHSRGMACSVYGAQALSDAVYNANDAVYGLQLLSSTDQRSWYNMIRAGSTISMEAWDNKYKSDQDWNHIWGAAAGNLIARKLMGIEPLEPGFKKIRIKPQPATLRQAEIKVPSIRGDIYVAFDNQPGERFVLKVEIPANTTAEIWLPRLAKNYRLKIDGVSRKGIATGNFVKVEIGSGKHVFEMESAVPL